jgi:cadmium resistance protein CadD (predicted permease)
MADLQTPIPERYLYLLGGAALLLLPTGARFLLQAGMRRAAFLVLLAQYGWIAHLLGLVGLAIGVAMLIQDRRRRSS